MDMSTRPMLLSSGASFNAPGISAEVVAEGSVGTLLNLPVYVANSLPSNHGSGTNQDEVIVMRGSDVFLYESELQLESFDATYANQASLLLRALNYAGMIPDRYSSSVQLVNGTGLVAPSLWRLPPGSVRRGSVSAPGGTPSSALRLVPGGRCCDT